MSIRNKDKASGIRVRDRVRVRNMAKVKGEEKGGKKVRGDVHKAFSLYRCTDKLTVP